MTEWGVVLVLIAVVGLVITILTPAIKLNTSVTKLATLVDSLNSKLSAMESNNSEAHRRIWGELDSQRETLTSHETRITVLEKSSDK